MTDAWAAEREDILNRFTAELAKPTGDGSRKRQVKAKPPWHQDPSHERAVFSHLAKWKAGELIDPDSGAHPLVHAAWRCLAIACKETGNVPAPAQRGWRKQWWGEHPQPPIPDPDPATETWREALTHHYHPGGAHNLGKMDDTD